jgi:hypothetical protein
MSMRLSRRSCQLPHARQARPGRRAAVPPTAARWFEVQNHQIYHGASDPSSRLRAGDKVLIVAEAASESDVRAAFQ